MNRYTSVIILANVATLRWADLIALLHIEPSARYGQPHAKPQPSGAVA